MLITRVSLMTTLTHTREIPCTLEQLDAYNKGALAQCAFPNLSAEDREFIMTGITPEEWNRSFGKGDDDEDED